MQVCYRKCFAQLILSHFINFNHSVFSLYLASNSNLTASCTPSDLDLTNGLNSNAEYPSSGTKCNLELLHDLEPSQPLTVDSISSAYASDEVFLKPQTNKSKQCLFLYFSSHLLMLHLFNLSLVSIINLFSICIKYYFFCIL